MIKPPKKLLDIADQYNYKIKMETMLGSGTFNGECDYAESIISVALKIVDDRGKLRTITNDSLLFTLAHELSHMIAYEEQNEDTNKLAEGRNIIYQSDLYQSKDHSTKAKLAALRRIYKNELMTDQQAIDILKNNNLFKQSMLKEVYITHMTFHKYYQLITTGAFCTADASRIPGLRFDPLWTAKISERNITLLNDFMNKHSQFREVGSEKNPQK